ncbi:MAG: LptF/LptG family permease, partial [Planctomycetota bacterium]
MTRIDRHILTVFARTAIICYASVAGILIVFHAFDNLEELAALGASNENVVLGILKFYGPHLLRVFDWTAAVIALMSMLFTVMRMQRSREWTVLSAAGIRTQRIVRPMLVASLFIIVAQWASREFLLPQFQNSLTAKPVNDEETPTPLRPCEDRLAGLVIEGGGVRLKQGELVRPEIRLLIDSGSFGRRIAAESAVWFPAQGKRPAGYLLTDVTVPANIDVVGAVRQTSAARRVIVITPSAANWLMPRQCFVVTAVDPIALHGAGGNMAGGSLPSLLSRIRNPAVRSSNRVHTLVHTRILRPLLDLSLIGLGVPLLVFRRDGNIFVVVGRALLIVAAFFVITNLASMLGGSGTISNPSLAA